VDPRLFADEHATFGTPADLLIIPDRHVAGPRAARGLRHRR
jgi:hypothetical protein